MDDYSQYHKYEFILDICLLKKRIDALEFENKTLKEYIVSHECAEAVHDQKSRPKPRSGRKANTSVVTKH